MLSDQVLILLQVAIKGGISIPSSEKFREYTQVNKAVQIALSKKFKFPLKKKKSAKPIPSKNSSFKHLWWI